MPFSGFFPCIIAILLCNVCFLSLGDLVHLLSVQYTLGCQRKLRGCWRRAATVWAAVHCIRPQQCFCPSQSSWNQQTQRGTACYMACRLHILATAAELHLLWHVINISRTVHVILSSAFLFHPPHQWIVVGYLSTAFQRDPGKIPA